MKRSAILIYGATSYAIFFATFLYAIGFVGNLVVPKSVDSGTPGGWPEAVAINAALLTIFALQHSVMARPFFKRWITRYIPGPAERSTYVLASSVAFILLFWAWRPMPEMVFSIADETARAIITAVFLGGVSLVLYSTFLIDHFDLFGLRQVVLHFRGRAYSEKSFVTPSLYKHIRHPLYVGWFVTFWATPEMSVGHLLLAIATTAYILVAIVFEERDLSHILGPDYRSYRARTPKFVPRIRGRREQPETVRSTA